MASTLGPQIDPAHNKPWSCFESSWQGAQVDEGRITTMLWYHFLKGCFGWSELFTCNAESGQKWIFCTCHSIIAIFLLRGVCKLSCPNCLHSKRQNLFNAFNAFYGMFFTSCLWELSVGGGTSLKMPWFMIIWKSTFWKDTILFPLMIHPKKILLLQELFCHQSIQLYTAKSFCKLSNNKLWTIFYPTLWLLGDITLNWQTASFDQVPSYQC